MGPYTTNGTIRQQDFEARNIARSAIARSLTQEANHTTILVTLLITQLVTSTTLIASIDDLWTRLQNNSDLRLLMNKTDVTVDAFTQFSGWVNRARFALASAQKRRLTHALRIRLSQQRSGLSVRSSSRYLTTVLSTLLALLVPRLPLCH
jgi:hypothetical protein